MRISDCLKLAVDTWGVVVVEGRNWIYAGSAAMVIAFSYRTINIEFVESKLIVYSSRAQSVAVDSLVAFLWVLLILPLALTWTKQKALDAPPAPIAFRFLWNPVERRCIRPLLTGFIVHLLVFTALAAALALAAGLTVLKDFDPKESSSGAIGTAISMLSIAIVRWGALFASAGYWMRIPGILA